MPNYTLNTNITTTDKSSRVFNKITRSFEKMSGAFSRKSKSSERAYQKFTRSVVRNSKRALVAVNNFEAGARRGLKRFSDKLINFKNAAIFATLAVVVGSVVGTFAEFEQANVNLASVMGKTVNETVALQNDAKRLGATTAKTATEVVGLQESFARLGFAETDILNMTESTIAGSVAMRSELSDTADLVGSMIKTFDGFESINAPEIMDQMTLATQKTALNFAKLSTGLPIVSGTANAAGIKFSKVAASLGILADAGIDASTAGTSFKKIIAVSAKSGISMEKSLQKIANSTDKVKTAFDIFGLTAGTQAIILADNIDKIDKLDKTLQNATGTAATTAARQLDTLKGSVTILGSAWEGFILSLEDGTGGFSNFLKTTVQVVTEILSLATGTAKATGELNKNQQKIRSIANAALTLLKVIKLVTIAYLSYKTVMIATRAAMAAYNVVGGVTIALTKGATLATNANKRAQAAYAVTTRAATVAQWAFSAALWANPITWVVIGVLALIAAVVALIVYWEEIVNWVQTSDSVFATLLRNALIPLKAMFHAIGFAIGWVVEKFKELINWVQTSDNWFAKFVRGSINSLILLFTKLGEVIGWLSDKWQKLNAWISSVRESIAKFINDNAGGVVEKVFGKDAKKELEIEANLSKIQKFIDKKGKKEIDISEDITTEITAGSNPLIDALNLNSNELDKNTNASKKEWKGKFTTSILKDANIPNQAIPEIEKEFKNSSIQKEIVNNTQKEIAVSGINKEFENNSIQKEIVNNNKIEKEIVNNSQVEKEFEKKYITTNSSIKTMQKEIAISGIEKEFKNSSIQKEIVNNNTQAGPAEVVTPFISSASANENVKSNKKSNNNNSNQQINITVFDKTGDNFRLEVEGTGVDVNTTGN